jgi:rod shape-determining protein MreB
MASAIGARLEVQEAGGNFIVDIGGGTTEVAVISLGGIVLAKSLRIAGDRLNEDIIRFAQDEYKLLIGERAAENVKIGIGSAHVLKEKKEMPLRGRNLVTGLPEEILVSDEDIRRALGKSIKQIVTAVKTTVEETPPELLSDIMANGIFLSGGGSLLRGLDILIQEEIKMPVRIVEDPMTAVVRGAGLVLEKIDDLHDILADTRFLESPAI